MPEHLSIEELLTSLKYCKRVVGSQGCDGCPNAVPGTENDFGLCKCRFNTDDEVIHLLESIINKRAEVKP